jgi:hypothetical protein
LLDDWKKMGRICGSFGAAPRQGLRDDGKKVDKGVDKRGRSVIMVGSSGLVERLRFFRMKNKCNRVLTTGFDSV